MGSPRPEGIPGWATPTHEDQPKQRGREPRYIRSIGWAILAWIAAVGAVYLVARVLGLPQLGGWLGLVGFVLGYWVGGARGGIVGTGEWVRFAIILSGIAVFAFGFGACIAAMAVYG